MTKKRKRAIIYSRNATGEGDALARRIAECRAYARAHGYTVTGAYSEVASGVALRLPEQARAIAQADGAALLCVDPMRLIRDVGRLAEVMAPWKCHGWLLARGTESVCILPAFVLLLGKSGARVWKGKDCEQTSDLIRAS